MKLETLVEELKNLVKSLYKLELEEEDAKFLIMSSNWNVEEALQEYERLNNPELTSPQKSISETTTSSTSKKKEESTTNSDVQELLKLFPDFGSEDVAFAWLTQFDGDKEKAISAFLDSKEQGQPLTKKAKLEEIDLTKEEEGDNDDFEDQKEEESNNENNTDSDFDSNAFQFSRTLTKNNINQTNERFLKWFSKHAPPQLDKNGWIWILEMSEHNFEKSIPSDHKIIAFQNEWANLMKQLKSQNHQSQLQALEKQYPDFNFGSSKKQTKKQIQETLMKWISMKSVEYNYLSGKWMLFVHTTKASEIWKKICIWILNSPDCVVKTAKISTRPNGAENEHVICIYTDDFRDEKTLEKTAKQLREIGIKHKLMYKSDVYTELGIYSHDKEGNPFELRTTLKIDTV